MTEHIVAVFRDSPAAEAAERELQEAGIPAAEIRRYSGESLGADSNRAVVDAERPLRAEPSGFWGWLLGEEPGSTRPRDDYRRDSDFYDRRAAAGDTVLSVKVAEDSQIHRAVAVLEAHHPVGIEETTEGAGEPIGQSVMPDTASTEAEGRTPQKAEEIIPLAKEEIEIGKRTVDRGTTRVRRYVVETPVEREVTLQGERITVERRRPTTASESDDREFQERVVEVHETDEEPVVQKAARVTEEVAIRREPTERAEKVRETVREEQVEITPDAGGPSLRR